MNVRFSIHNVSVQTLPPTGRHPRKPFGKAHTPKPSGRSRSYLVPIKARKK